MSFSCQERSETGQETSYYGVEPNEETGFGSLLYRYDINLSRGHLYLLLLPDSKTRVLDRYNQETPS